MEMRGQALEARVVRPAAAVDLAELIAIFRRRKWSIVWTVGVITALAGAVGLQREPIYTATADILIAPEGTEFAIPEVNRAGVQQVLAEATTQLEILQSQGFRAKLVDSLDLLGDPAFNPSLAAEERPRADRAVDPKANSSPATDRLWAWLVEDGLKLAEDWLNKLAWLSPDRWLVAQSPAKESFVLPPKSADQVSKEAPDQYDARRAHAIALLAEGLTATQPGGSFLVRITYSSPDPRLAARIANGAAELFVEQRRQVQLEASERGVAWLAKRVVDLREELAEAERAVKQFKADNDLLDPEAGRLIAQELAEVNKEVVSLRALLAEKRSQLAALREKVERGEGIDAVSEIAPSALLADLRHRESQLVQEEAELQAVYGPKHPRYLAWNEERARLTGQIEAVVDRIIRGMETDLRIVSAREQALVAEFEILRHRNRQQSQLRSRLEELEHHVATTQALYEPTLLRLKEKREQVEFLEARAQIASRALVPVLPSSGGPIRFLLIGFVASGLLSAMVALLRERLDTRFRSEHQIREELGLEPLGVVPHLSRRMRARMRPHRYVMEYPQSAYAEGIRAVYTGLRAGNTAQVVLISSASPHEGKTTLALSLAVFAARAGHRVLVIDFDLRRPEVARTLVPPKAKARMPSEPGVVDCVLHDVPIQDAVLHHSHTGVDLLPVLRRPQDPTAVLSSPGLDRVIAEARAAYDVVVLDSPPVLAVLDAQELAQRCDAVLFLANWDKTSRAAALNALNRLRSFSDKVAGVALVGVKLRRYAQDLYCSSGKEYRRIAKYYLD